MPTNRVNLDALIKREDFDVTSTDGASMLTTTTLQLSELEPDKMVYQLLRKPDFQRETADWDPKRVAELIESFVVGDLIPSLILWKSVSGNVFVIDGAHRLSALIAWVRDDYGDKDISLDFFRHSIPPEQIKAAERTRKLVRNAVGSYEELKTAGRYPGNVTTQRLQLAKNVAVIAIQLQWVLGDAQKAESSYFKINQQAVTIDPTELAIIKSRRKPNALATRSLIRAGTGHKYWSAFPQSTQQEIENTAREIYDTLFKPHLETPLRSLDIPIAGHGYSGESVKMVFDLVNLINDVDTEMLQDKPKVRRGRQSASIESGILPDDQDGSQALKYLKAVKRVASRIGSLDPSSLGLHPAVYFYGTTGRFLPMTFLAVAEFVRELERTDAFRKFTEVRSQFEEFLLEHRDFVYQIGQKSYSEKRSKATLLMYQVLFKGLSEGKSVEDIIKQMQSHAELNYLTETPGIKTYGREFSTETKSAVYLRHAIDNSLRCTVCKARLHSNSISFDHIERKQDGGVGTPDNAQMTHPYCNTGYKEWLNSQARQARKDKTKHS